MNPRLYALAAASPSSFHDVTTGDNKVPFRPSTLERLRRPAGTVSIGYSAGPGYDLVTGLGSIDAQSFVDDVDVDYRAARQGRTSRPIFSCRLSPAALTVRRGACGTTQLTLTTAERIRGHAHVHLCPRLRP